EPRLVEDPAGGGRDLRKRANLREDAFREARRRHLDVARVRERRVAGDHGVGILVRAREDRVERLRDRVGEDEGAADHRYAEDDREAGQDGAELPPEQALQGDGGHFAVSSSIAEITSLGSERPRSLTIK